MPIRRKSGNLFNDPKGMKFGREKCAMLIMRIGKRQIMEGKELPNQERIRTLGGKRNQQVLGILEADKQVEMKERIQKDERENFLKPSSAARNSSKGSAPGLSLL